MADNKYITGYAKLGTSSCKKCKQKIDKGALRIGKVTTNPFSDEGGDMKQWYHPQCMFETFKRARATTKKIEEPDDVDGFTDLQQEDKDVINKLIKEFLSTSKSPGKKKTPVQTRLPPSSVTPTHDKPGPSTKQDGASSSKTAGGATPGADGKDNLFREFRRLCADIAEENSYTGKTQLVAKFLTKGSSGDGFQGDQYVLLKLLLPGVVKRVYNLNNKQLVKLFSQAFGTSLKEMVEDLEQGDVAETVRIFFEDNKLLTPQKKSTLSLQEVDAFLDELAGVTKEDDQQKVLTKIAKRCTGNDLKMVVRLIKHDLRINAGAKHILDGLDPNAYAAFQASRNLKDVVDRVLKNQEEGGGVPGMKKTLSVRASLMTPVLPMLAEACRSVDYAMKKCPNGFYAEIKYDGERVQLHKKGDQFQYFSRSLKPVLPHKVAHFKEYIPKAFPSGDNLILDAEVLLVDTNTSKPLPFGTLGVHKKAKFEDANVCLFVFDCLHLNGENLMEKPIKQRRKILHENMTEIKNRVMFSEMNFIKDPEDLTDLMTKVFQEGLEGLVLKDVNSLYEPGKRHWLKVKKDYLHEGSMADSADLSVIGAYYGTGNKGGLMSVFLMGVYDPKTEKWCTVTKCGNGLDDKTIDQLQKQLDMVKISKKMEKVPDWLNINKGNILPDFVVADPKKAPVWEIVGAEFSKSDSHTAGGISIRFPRVTKFRDDKSWKEATDLQRLKELYEKSKDTSDIVIPGGSKKGKGKTPVKGKKKSEDGDSGQGSDTENGNASDASAGTSGIKVTPKKEPSTPSKAKGSITKYFSPVKTGSPSSDHGTPGKGTKRRSSDDEEDGPTPKKQAKPVCMYGSDCYQTNPQHLAKFSHPPKTETKSSSDTLPNIFSGAQIYLPEDIPQYKKLKRFIVAFDGDLVQEFSKSTATHTIVAKPDSPKIPCKGVCVTVDWLWDCVKKKQLIPTADYKVE